MMRYKDKTYCASPDCNNACGRQLTDDIRQGARASNMLLSMGYFCGVPESVTLSAGDWIIGLDGIYPADTHEK